VVELATWRHRDLVQITALAHAEHRILGELVGDTDAACAHDAALGVVDDGRTEHDGLRLVDRLVVHALLRALMLEPVVLQPALSRLIADRAIHGVIEQQQLLHRRAGPHRVLAGLALDHHAVGRRLLTGRL
jgi:hypothetical protein